MKDKENNLNNKYRNATKQAPPIVGGGSGGSTISNGDPIPFQRSLNNDDHHNFMTSSNSLSVSVRPQPAPRLSINSRNISTNNNTTRDDIHSPPNLINQHKTDLSSSSSFNSSSENHQMDGSFTSVGSSALVSSMHSNEFIGVDGDSDNDDDDINQRSPPPLPPKPKILPIKPSNWGQSTNTASNSMGLNLGSGPPPIPAVSPLKQQHHQSSSTEAFKVPKEWPRRLGGNNNNKCNLNNNLHNENEDIKTQRNIYLDQPSSSFV